MSGLKGLEREALRVTPEGRIARTPHPAALGSALTHPAITTDYSEALLEFVTAPHAGAAEVLEELRQLEAFAARSIGDELLWVTSMPCFIDDPATIPIARYGSSNAGRMKHLYRVGLSHRYGSGMQVIAGIHFNYSYPESLWTPLLAARGLSVSRAERDRALMGVVRNVQRHGWMLLYLFGASPAICPSFTAERPCWLKSLPNGALVAPNGTSLRLSDIGYKNRHQAYLSVSTNSLDEYVADLTRALATEDPAYAEIGVRDGAEWKQLSTAILQIENEYYGLVRPKARPRLAERPSVTLAREGIRYVEVRALDIDPTTPLGIGEETMRFLELFMWFCLLAPSPPLGAGDRLEINYNQRNVAARGREPGLKLCRNGGEQSLRDWGHELCEQLAATAAHFDTGLTGRPYTTALELATARFDAPGLTPSAQALVDIAETPKGFLAWALARSRGLTRVLREIDLPEALRAQLEQTAADSLAKQRAMEMADRESFEDYLARYYEGGGLTAGKRTAAG